MCNVSNQKGVSVINVKLKVDQHDYNNYQDFSY